MAFGPVKWSWTEQWCQLVEHRVKTHNNKIDFRVNLNIDHLYLVGNFEMTVWMTLLRLSQPDATLAENCAINPDAALRACCLQKTTGEQRRTKEWEAQVSVCVCAVVRQRGDCIGISAKGIKNQLLDGRGWVASINRHRGAANTQSNKSNPDVFCSNLLLCFVLFLDQSTHLVLSLASCLWLRAGLDVHSQLHSNNLTTCFFPHPGSLLSVERK